MVPAITVAALAYGPERPSFESVTDPTAHEHDDAVVVHRRTEHPFPAECIRMLLGTHTTEAGELAET
eukprot:7981763-Alexandrium_andersonii.AAC.1